MYSFLPRLFLETFFILGVLGFVIYTFETGLISSIPFLALFGVAGLRALMAIDSIYQSCISLAALGDVRGQAAVFFAREDTLEKNAQTKTFDSLSLEAIDVSYNSDNPILRGLSFHVGQKEMICIQ